MSQQQQSELDKWFGRVNGKSIATKTIAQQLAEWCVKHGIAAIVVFGADVLYCLNTAGAQVPIPTYFNNFVWGMVILEALSLAFKAAKEARRHAKRGQNGLNIIFIAGVKPGDPGHEVPDPPDWSRDTNGGN